MNLTASQLSRNPRNAFKSAANGETISIKNDWHPDFIFELTARPKKFTECRETNITRIAQRALGGVDVDFATGGPIPGAYTAYALMVAAEIFRQVMQTTSNNMTRGNIFQIAHEIERAKE